MTPVGAGSAAGHAPGRSWGWRIPRRATLAALLAIAAFGAAIAGTLLRGAGAVVGVLVAAVLAGIAARRAGPVIGLLVVFLACVLQNLMVTPLAAGMDRGAVLALLVTKETLALSVGATGLWLLGRRLRLLAADVAAVVFVALVVLVALASGSDSLAAVATVRQALTLPFLWLLGRTLGLDGATAGRAVGVVLGVGLLVAAFGLAERFVLGDGFWTGLGLASLYEKKGLGAFLQGALPANFYTWDWGRPLRRLVGTLGEPTTSSHLLALPAALVVGAKSVRGGGRPTATLATTMVLLAALVLTLGKSGIATFLAGVSAALWIRGPAYRRAGLAVLVVAGGALLVGVAVSPNLQKNLALHGAGFLHLARLGAAGIGGGFGTAGNLSAAIARDSTVGIATESFVAALALQAGLAAVVIFAVFCAAATRDLLVQVAGGGPRDVRAVLAGLVAATGLTSLASETPVGFIAGGLVFLVAGALAAPPGRFTERVSREKRPFCLAPPFGLRAVVAPEPSGNSHARRIRRWPGRLPEALGLESRIT